MPRKLIGKLCTAGMQGPKGNDYVITEKDYEEIAKKVEPIGIPKGGTTNQILQKKSDNDYDTEWVDNQAVGQVESVNGKTGKVELTADDVGATTQEWVKEQGYLTEHQDISELATKEEVTEVENKIPSLNGYATETWVENKGYLTEHQSLENYPTKQDVDTTVSNYHDDTKQDKLTPGNNITIDENNVISATGGGSGGKEYTFTNGLTETDGTVSWDLNDIIIRNGNSIAINSNVNYLLKMISTNGFAWGLSTGAKIEGSYPFSIGQDNATGSNTVWAYNLGTGNKNYGRCSFCIGSNNKIYTAMSNNTGSVFIGNENIGNIIDTNQGQYGIGRYCFGSNLLLNWDNQTIQGYYNIADTNNTYRWIFGNGDYYSRSNAFTIDKSGNGTFAGTVSSSTGADYAEYFEWKDGNLDNEDRIGYIVCLDEGKIRLANKGDDILGICSGTAMVLGDSAEWNWSKRYLTDDFGRIIYEDVEIEHEAILDEDGNVIEEAHIEQVHRPVQNPDYDSSKPYERRSDRPEWQIVGMMGKLYVRDNGTCEVNGYADVENGIAVKSNEKTNMRVMERVTDNIVRVLLK